jgi:hypothetical protein
MADESQSQDSRGRAVRADVAEAWELVEAGDVPGVMRHLRFTADRLPIAEVARITERAAGITRFDDLVSASTALAEAPHEPQALFDYGYACIERGVSFLAIPALSAALRQVPGSPVILTELVAALEDEGRHAEAVAVLTERDADLRGWPDRYLLVFNALMAGDPALARANFDKLPVPEDKRWLPARDRVQRMLDRAAVALSVSPLDHRDLRAWHFVITGGVLGTLSPYGFEEGMTGRYAYTQDSFGQCLHGLHRLQVILDASGRHPRTVSLLTDRSSRILGLAAAELLGLPAEPFAPDRPETVVVAYDLGEIDGELAARLRDRSPGQVLYEHVTCWTAPPPVSADVSTLLAQMTTAPWGEQLRVSHGTTERVPSDPRPAEELAAEILRADPAPDTGDGETPPDPDETLTGFVTGVRDGWLIGPREQVRSSGPVPSSRFL